MGLHCIPLARAVGSKGKVAAFEANPATIKLLEYNCEINCIKLDIINKAVHNIDNDLVNFYITRTPGMCSMLMPEIEYINKLNVKTITLDSYISEQCWHRLDLIKIDAEGNDLNVIEGARKTIQYFKPFLTFEWSKLQSAEYIKNIFLWLIDLGYTIEVEKNDHLYTFNIDRFNFFCNQNTGHFNVFCHPFKK